MSKRKLLAILVLTSLVLSLVPIFNFPLPVAADVLATSKETYIRQNLPTSTYSGNYYQIWDKTGSTQRGLVEFDISSIPDGATITEATLEMYYEEYHTSDPVGKILMVYKVTRTDWVEGQACWNDYKTGTTWTTGGGDYDTSLNASTIIPETYSWMSWDILDIVNDAYGGTDKVELLIRYQTEGLGSGDGICQIENSAPNSPKLTILYGSSPSIETEAASSITSSTAVLNSEILSDGEGVVSVRFGWGESSEAVIEDYASYEVVDGTYTTGQHPYLGITDLSGNTTYYFRVEGTNDIHSFDDDVTSTIVDSLGTLYFSNDQIRGKLHYVGGRYWAFYGSYYKTSTDGITWTSATACTSGSIWLDGNFFHQSYISSDNVYYRRGQWDTDGTIAWDITYDTGANARTNSADICTDSEGYPWITYRGTDEYVYAMKSSVKDGTWATESGFPDLLSGDANAGYYSSIEPLLDGEVAVLWQKCITPTKCKVWDGDSWGSEEVAIDELVADMRDFHTLSYEGKVYAAGYAATGRWVNIRDVNGNWGTEELVSDMGGAATMPTLCLDTEWDILYCFWNNANISPNIYYKTRVAGEWSTNYTLWIDETTDGMDNSQSNIMATRYATNGTVAITYGTETLDTTPYKIKFAEMIGTGSSVLGDELSFITSSAPPAVPTVSTGSAAGETQSSATIQGSITSMGDESTVYVYFQWGLTTGYEKSPTAEQTKIAIGGFSASLSSLSASTLYYYRAVLRYGSTYVYGTQGNFTTLATSGSPGMDEPDAFLIESAEVFGNYMTDVSGDQLYVVSYKIVYDVGTPTQNINDFFILQILDGGTLRAQGTLPSWGYGPASLYLSSSAALTWGGSYTVRIIGRADMWDTPPEATQELSSSNWMGTNLDYLDEWVLTLAERMGTFDDTTYLTYVPGYDYILNAAGGAKFEKAIPNLRAIRPDLFSSGGSPVDLPTDVPSDRSGELITNLGPEVMDYLDALGEYTGGISGETVGTIIWLAIAFLVLGGLGFSGKPILALTVILPEIIGGVYLGIMPISVVITLGVLAILGATWQLVLKGV